MTGRRVAAFLGLAALLAALLVGCGGGDDAGSEASGAAGDTGAAAPAEDEQVSIAFFNPVAANAYTAATFEAVQEVAAEMNAEVTGFDAGFDQNKQISQMQDAIVTGRYDAFIVMPVNGTVLTDVTSQAIEEGIEVVAVFNNVGPDLDSIEPQVEGVASVVASKLSENGKRLGEAIVAACEGVDPCRTVYMPGSFKQATEKIRLDALEEVVGAHSNVELIASAEGGYLADPALKAATDVLQANPDVDVFATSGDQMMTGIIQAVEQAGLTGEVKLIGNGTTIEGVKWVRDGILFADPVAVPASEGRKAAELAIKAARGEEVPASVDSVTLSPIGPVATEESLSTPEGQEFEGEYNG